MDVQKCQSYEQAAAERQKKKGSVVITEPF